MSEKIQISDAEWDVMEQIWAVDDCTAADVIRALRDSHDWNQSTIRTLLARLVDKGVIAYDVDGTKYIYRAKVSRQSCIREEGKSFLKKVFGGDVTALVTHFVEEASLNPEQIEELRKMLADKKSTRRKSK